MNSALSGSLSQSNPALSCILERQPAADAFRRLGTRGFATRELARDKRPDFFGKYSGFWSLVCLSSKATCSGSDALGPSLRNSRALRIAQQRTSPRSTKNPPLGP